MIRGFIKGTGFTSAPLPSSATSYQALASTAATSPTRRTVDSERAAVTQQLHCELASFQSTLSSLAADPVWVGGAVEVAVDKMHSCVAKYLWELVVVKVWNCGIAGKRNTR